MSIVAEGIERLAESLDRNDLIASGEAMRASNGNEAQIPVSAGPIDDGLPPMIRLSDWIVPEELPQELISGVLHRGTKMIVSGGSKTFKTWTLMDMAISVCRGQPWLGFECTPTHVLYINLELPSAFCQRRVHWIADAMDSPLCECVDLSIWNLRGYARPAKGFFELIIRRIAECSFGLIIIDPVYKLLGEFCENSAEDINSLMNVLEAVVRDTGAAVVFGHHFSKGNQAGKEAIDRVSGSGVWARDPDTIMSMTRHEEEDAFTVDFILRNQPPIDRFVVRWDFPLMRREDDLNPNQLRGLGRGRTYSWEQLLQVLDDYPEGLHSTEWQAECDQQFNMGSSTFYRLRRQALNSELFRHENNLNLPLQPPQEENTEEDESPDENSS